MADRKSQRTRILELLLGKKNQWVPLPELVKISCQYGARLLEARRAGYEIVNKTERQADGSVHSWFKLTAEPLALTISESPAVQLGHDGLVTGCYR